MNNSLPKRLHSLCNTYLRHRSYSEIRVTRTVNRLLQQRPLLCQSVPQTVYPYTHQLTTNNLHTSCCNYQTTGEDDKNTKESFMKRHWWPLTIASGVFGVSLLTYSLNQYKKTLQIEKALQFSEEVGDAKVGIEDWELIDSEGNKFTNKDLIGKWVIFYFGFTHCPDICPDELDKLAAVSDIIDLNPSLPNMQVVFVSVDPERDTSAVIKEYLSEFSRKFIGLTGTLEQVKHAGRQYRVYFSKGKQDQDGDYIVDHSIITYLVDPKGKFVEFYSRAATSMEIANKVEKKMLEYKKKK